MEQQRRRQADSAMPAPVSRHLAPVDLTAVRTALLGQRDALYDCALAAAAPVRRADFAACALGIEEAVKIIEAMLRPVPPLPLDRLDVEAGERVHDQAVRGQRAHLEVDSMTAVPLMSSVSAHAGCCVASVQSAL